MNERIDTDVQRMDWEGGASLKPETKSQGFVKETALTARETRLDASLADDMDWQGSAQVSRESAMNKLTRQVRRAVVLDGGSQIQGSDRIPVIALATEKASRAKIDTAGTQIGGFGEGNVSARGRQRLSR